MIYFDNAATTAHKPQKVIAAVQNAIKRFSANPGRGGHNASLKAADAVFSVREKAAEYFNANSAENVVFTQNCTLALNVAMQGLFHPGDHIIISSLEHNAVYRTAMYLRKKGIDFSVAEVSLDEDTTVNNFVSLIRYNTKGIVCTHASNVFGIVLPIKRLGKVCSVFGLRFIVDAAQTAGVLPIDMKECHIDCLCIAPHKGLYSPMGTGILITDNSPKPLVFGGTGSNSIDHDQPEFLPDKYESGTINVPGICGIGAGIDFIKQNRSNAYKKEMKLIRYIYSMLSKKENVLLYTPVPDKRFVPLLSLNIRGENSEAVAAKLNENNIAVRAGLHCAPLAHRSFGTINTGTVRVSPSIFNTENEAEYFVHTVKKNF
ncbi:MAG: aminotransferase class V-fold PLP-dependent enzyme [Acutalibacteraceae bacterium]|nr:aminotransferase class V-fold PLP-dependent enzyme [Acutalibacteraceae bacterium]